jgi:transposase
MTRKHLWVGLDIGVETMACCVIDDDGGVKLEERLPTSAVALKDFLRPIRRKVSLIALEAGSTSIHLARSLLRFGFLVSVFDTRQVSRYLKIRQNKTDKNDARGLAEIARTGRLVVSKVYLKDPEIQHLRSTLVMRQNLLRMRMVGEGAIRSIIRLNGGRLKSSKTAAALRRDVNDELCRLRKFEKVDLRQEIEPILKLCESLRLYLKHSESVLAVVAKQNQPCRRFMEIPGVGPICALSFYTAIGDPSRFDRNADVGPYLGMTPLVRQSGQTVARLRISKMGSRMTRSHLITAAGLHIRWADSAIRDWGIALQERAGKGRARVAVARKLAVTMIAIWKTGRAYEARPSHDLPLHGEATGSEIAPDNRTATILNGLLAEPVDTTF